MDVPMSSAGPSASNPPRTPSNGPSPEFMIDDPQFDIIAWHQAYQSCQRYFIDHSQHNGLTQAAASLLNIRLPFQWASNPVISTGSLSQPSAPGFPASFPRQGPMHTTGRSPPLPWVSLVPYIRRLVITGWDTDAMLHGFFGDDWRRGIGPIQECERRNFLFAAKSVGWAKVKFEYDISPEETVPFMRPLRNVQLVEIEMAERKWSEWLAMEDWMVGPRAPEGMEERSSAAREEMAQDPERP